VEYREHIQKAIDYIEENLTFDLEMADIARASCYSQYHFQRIFKEVTKLTPAEYIRKRRLTEVIMAMPDHSGSLSELAFRFGFNSKESFTRAFKMEHHILPTEYKRAMNSLKLYERLSFDIKPLIITPRIAELEGFSLRAFPCDEEYVPNFWNKYNCRKLSLRLTGGAVCADYGVSVYDGKLKYYIGVRSEFARGDLEGTVEIKIPGGMYALFETPRATHYDFVSTIHRTWEYINTQWQPENGYERKAAPEFETYIESSRSFKELIAIPIQKRSG